MDGNNQPQPPDPTQYNLRDPQQLAEFYRANSAYNLTVVQRAVQTARALRTRQAIEPLWQYTQQTSRASSKRWSPKPRRVW